MKTVTVKNITAAALLLLSLPAFAQTPRTLSRASGGETPVLDYQPAGAALCPETLIVSHGFGGDQSALAPLARHMLAKGWRVIVMSHQESGRAELRQAFQAGGGFAGVELAARDPGMHAARFRDLDAAYALAVSACRPKSMILAGHSMGAQTVMMEAGAAPLIGRMGSDRFDAYIAISPQGIGAAYAAGAWARVSKPVLMITGSNDRTAGGDYRSRLSAFEGLPPGRKRLAIIPGAGHLQVGQIGSENVSSAVNALAAEFAAQIASGAWAPSRIQGADVREK